MLYFQTKPNPVFLVLLHHSLESELQEIARLSKEKDLDAWSAEYAHISQVFTPYTALVTLEQLTVASQDEIVYRLTDPHWLLIYECLKNYSAIHNDLLHEEQAEGITIGTYRFHEIDFDFIAEQYFWDTDFLFLADSPQFSNELIEWRDGSGEEPIDLTRDIRPFPSQLKMIPVEDPAWQGPLDYDSFGIVSNP